MIYSNDETDKAERKRNYILTVVILPISIALIIGAICYAAPHQSKAGRFNSAFGYYFAVLTGIIMYGFNKRNWLKMPDGTFHNIKDVLKTKKISLNEPGEYEEEYFIPKKEKIISIILGAFMIGIAFFLGIKGVRGILLPIFMGCIGVSMVYMGVKALRDKSPRLKLAKEGLWTAKLGFVDWNDIAKAQVIVDKGGRSPQTILEISVKGTVFAEANKPDERLNLTAIENKEYIETVINNLILKRSELAG